MASEVLKILAIDDNADNLITLKAVLRDALPAARVLTAASGPAGIALARAEDPDVILLDIIMPEMDGFAVCRALKADEHTAGTPVVFLTALRSDRKNRVEALEAGAEGFLAKPLDEIELVAQIRVMAKIKAANRAQQSERERLAALVAERTRELKQQLAARVHAEALERKQAAKLNSIYRAAPAGIGMVINRVIQDANDTLCEMTGYARAELLGRNARFLYPTDADYDFVGDEKYRQIAQGGSGTVETRWRRKDGAIIDILLSSAALDPADLTRGVAFTALDITKRKRAEVALHESEARYRRLTDNARDIIFRYSLVPEMRLTYINPAVEELTGYSPAECYADPQLMLNLVHPADRPMIAGFMATLSAPDQPFTMRWIGKDGGVRWMESKVVPVYDAAGRFVAVEGITRDMTARVQAEAALQESEARHRAIFENMAAACCVDEVIFENGQAVDYRILDVNPAFERITGIPRSQAAGALASAVYGTGQTPFLDIYSRVAATGEPAAFEAHFPPINKDLYITVGSPGPGRFSTVFSDITERKQAERALRQANERLSLAQHAAGAGMWDWDMTTGQLEWSPEFFQLLGLNPDTSAATFDVWREMLHPQDRQQAEERINDAIRDRIPLTNEYRIVMPSGEVRWIYTQGDTLYDMQGQPTRMAGICLNITERKQVEAALRERENLLQKIFDILPIGLWFADQDGRLLRGNPAGVAIWGAEPKVAPAEYGVFKARRLPAGEEIAPDDWALAHTIREGVTVVDELLEIEAFDGRKKTILNYTAPVLDEAGAVLGALVVNQDVTERVQAEAALRASDELTRRLLAQQVAIHQLALALGESLDLNAVYRTIHQHIQGMMDVWCFIISSYDQQSGLIRAEYAADERVYDVTVFPPIPLGPPDSGTQSRVIHSGQPLYTPDHWQAINQSNVRYTIEHDGTVHEEELSEREKDTTRSAIYLPMKIKGQTVGILQVQSRRLDAYSPDDINLLAGMANVAAMAIQNARLHQDVLHELQERQRAEAALITERTLLRTLVDNLPDSIYVKDITCRKTLANPANLHHIGATTEADVLGKTDFDLFPCDLATAFNTDDLQVMQTGQSILNREERVTLPDGSLGWQTTSKVPLRDSAGQIIGLVGIGHDITERVQAEERLRATLAELQRSNADLERFVYIASHDLQEPLRMVASYAQLLDINYRGRLDADADEFIGYLVEGAMRIHQLLLDLLDYSSISPYSSHPQPTDAAVSYEMALNNLAPLIAGNAATITCDPLPTVLADPMQLTELIQNLIGNAIKFHGVEPPVVHISARQTFEVSETAKVSAPVWEFAVRDNGIGIEPQYFERIFVIFQRLHTRRKYQGSGIGLAICKRIIERHGGRIWVESAPEQGSTFYFTLPAEA